MTWKANQGIRRKIVDRVEVPYDRDRDGQPLTLLFDVLECGHRMRTVMKSNHGTAVEGEYKVPDPRYDTRGCKKCEQE